MTTSPAVCILLATYNGAAWLDEQLQSVVDQQNVEVSVIASDDHSSDTTPLILSRWAQCYNISMLPRLNYRCGRAHRNFLRLVRDADVADAKYVALCDQDDIWHPDKLTRAVQCLENQQALGYSSNVTAFWPDGRRRVVDKAQPQRSYDHFFGSPGPGCTFVLPRASFDRLQAFVSANFDRLQSIWVHDWLIYAFVRCGGGRWFIDDRSTMLYRQHGRNEIGVNEGWRAALDRLRRVRSGEYRHDVLAIADALGEHSIVVGLLRRLLLADRLRLVMQARHCRRRLSDSVVLAFFFLVMPRA